MLSNSHPALTSLGGRGRRALSFLLLGLIIYGTTIQAVHKHGTTLPAQPESVVVSAPTSEDSNINGAPGCADCLVCQLQQSFATPLATHRNLEAPIPQTAQFFNAGMLPLSSFVTTKESGRAPPFTS